jgi:tyrosyl-tRNA synthetase
MEEAMRLGELNPRDAKAQLARTIVTMYHDAEAARVAEQEFNRVFREKGLPDEMPYWTAKGREGVSLVQLIVDNHLAASKSAARRLIKEGAVAINGEKIQNIEYQVQPGPERILKVGKRGFLKVRFP